MKNIKTHLAAFVQTAISNALGDEHAYTDPQLQPSTKPEHGDFQANFAMRLAKQLKHNPREIAEKVVQTLGNEPAFKKVEVAGPGFINLTLSHDFIADRLCETADGLFVDKTDQSDVVVVDYGSANVAKEMHVGHLRSTVIGDAIVRILTFLGHKVIKQNHLGDWGTQFGMLIQYLTETGWEKSDDHSISDLNILYQAAKKRFDDDEDFASKARQRVVDLQANDPFAIKIWKDLVIESEKHFMEAFERLDVLLKDEDTCAESFYNDKLAPICEMLETQGVAEISDGALVVFLEEFVTREGNPLPLMIRKSDGGYLYSTTDLAAIRYRTEILNSNRVVYVVDARQKQHFAMVFATANKAGWIKGDVQLEHVPFGAILGKDRKPFKTRSGETIKLKSLLDEAEERAHTLATKKNPNLTDEEAKKIAHCVGIGALKYADLSSDKVKDYVFDWDRMLAFDGNTAPYLQNAYVRIQSIFRKGEINPDEIDVQHITLNDLHEKKLALKILDFSDTITSVGKELAVHRLCNYLYELASTYHSFYEHCPILNQEDEKLKTSRLALSVITAKTLKQGLDLLGIKTLDKM